ncbi:MAG: histidine kinase [Bacteroidota bacterium]
MRVGGRVYWIAQIFGWSAYATLVVMAAYEDNPDKMDVQTFLNALTLVVAMIFWTHMMRLAFVRLGWLDLKPFKLLPRILISSLICAFLISVSTTAISLYMTPKDWQDMSFLSEIVYVLSVYILVIFWNAIYFTFHFFQKSKKQELNNISLEASKNEIELKNLRSQLNPHFLFNSLNSIKALIELEPETAKKAVTTLSILLRKSLVMGKENLVLLSDELEMVKNYLDLEKIRFEERLMIEWKTDESLNSMEVPPFILQMLVENAIKHGISNLMDGGIIRIESRREDDAIYISVENSGQLSENIDTGIGLQNIKRRLDLQFNKKVEFELIQKNNKVVAQLIFYVA